MMRFVRPGKSILTIAISLGYLSAIAPLPSHAEYNYGEALKKSLIFYEAQQAGKLPEWNRVPWRGDSVLEDGSDVGVDLSGGWFDAGDHIKFGLPMAYTVTMLSWGGIEYYEAFEQSNQLIHLERNLQWATDYLLKAFANDNPGEYVLYGQVSNGEDHNWWVPAEEIHHKTARPAYKIDTKCPGSDLAAETAAAMASSSILFRRTGNTSYADLLVEQAEKLYDFADRYRGNYSDCIPAAPFYKTHNGHQDDIVWGAIWLHRAKQAQDTNYSGNYLAKAISEYPPMPKPFDYTIGYDDKTYGVYVLLAQETGDRVYQENAEAWLDFWTIGSRGKRITYTPGGLAFLNKWGSLVGSSMTSFVSLIYSDWLREQGAIEKADRYRDFSFAQINYILGDNPDQRSYIVGFGDDFPRNPHHRTAHGSSDNNGQNPAQNRNLIIGALVGGPDEQDRWEDDRDDYVRNEVAVVYNAGLVGALARMYLEFGGEPPTTQIYPATPKPGIYLDQKLQQRSSNATDS